MSVKHELPLCFSEEGWKEFKDLQKNIVDQDEKKIEETMALWLGLCLLNYFVETTQKEGHLLEEVSGKLRAVGLPGGYKVVIS